MFSRRAIDRETGILLLMIVVAFAVSLSTFVETDIDREDIRSSLQNVIDDQALYFTSWSFNLVGGLLIIVAGVGLYLLLRPYEQALALIGLIGLVSAGVTFAVATMSSYVLFFLADDFVIAVGSEADALASTARAVGLAGTTVYLTALTLVGVGVLPMGVLIIWSGAASKWLGWWAVVSGILMLLAWTVLVQNDIGFAILAVGSIGVLLFFLMLGLRLIFRGMPASPSQ